MMKKYLMLGVAALALAGCTNHDFEPTTQAQIDQAKYADAFKTYLEGGTIDPNQNWGFSDAKGKSGNRAMTRAASPNGNQWEGNGHTIPADITPEEVQKVLAVFNQKGEASYTSKIDLSNYFVQQVYKGVATYTNHAGGLVTGSNHMDWICAVTNKRVNIVSWWPYEEEIVYGDDYDDHINNFNNGSCHSSYTSEASGRAIKDMMLMLNSETRKFGFKSSEDNGHVFYNFRMEEIDGNYYVGFDFEAAGQNPNEQVDRDYIYNDWIVKIVPAEGVTPAEDLRIIVEDLSATSASDFDFNDVVLDVEMGNPAKVTLIAAGGVLPLRICGKDEWEVHKLFGVWVGDDEISASTPAQQMVNTGAGPEVEPVVLEGFNESITTAAEANTKIKLEVFKNGQWQELTAVKGEPACKLAVGTSFSIMGERESIKGKYDKFLEWATGSNFSSKWW